MHQKLSKRRRRTVAIRIINATIRELTERLEKLIDTTDKHWTIKNMIRTSETLINAWITMKNLTEKKKRDSVAQKPQDNLGFGQDLTDLEREMIREWKKDSQPGYDTEELLKTGPSTEETLKKEGKRIRLAMEDDIA